MLEKNTRTELQGLYGALLGGLIASFVGVAIFGVLSTEAGPVADSAAMIAMLVGVGCVVVFMIGGVYAREKLPWLARALLFASGFTAIWSGGISFGVQQRWVVVAAFGVAIAVGVTIGLRRFGREPEAAALDGDEAAWTH